MPSFQDSVFLFVLALLLFGPKKLPVLARELGKWVGEFRRASNEFKMQMEDELRQSEQAERLKKIEAMEAAAPTAPALETTPTVEEPAATEMGVASEEPAPAEVLETAVESVAPPNPVTPLPIAEAGEVKIMPPSTGLPAARSRSGSGRSALGGLLDSIPAAEKREEPLIAETAETTHGD
jgi:sec-independent protein translocase protein TatB